MSLLSNVTEDVPSHVIMEEADHQLVGLSNLIRTVTVPLCVMAVNAVFRHMLLKEFSCLPCST